MERLSPLDAAFLHIERDEQPMHIGSVAVFEGPVPTRAEMTGLLEAKLPLVPRYRQRIATVPLQLGRPVWVDDPHFRLDYHLRMSALAPPGGEDELRHLVGRVMGQRLDRARPLWEMWVVAGLEDGAWALISKTHHCMVDGVSGTDLLTEVLDDAPDAELPAQQPWQPEPTPSTVELMTDATLRRLVSPYEQLRAARAVVRRPREVGRRAVTTVRGALEMTGAVRPVDDSPLTGSIGPHRRWGFARTSLDDVKVVRQGLGGSVNDVVLACVTRGFRDLLRSTGTTPRDGVLRSLVPVSVRDPSERGTYNNRVSAMFAELPVGEDDPVARLRSVHAQMQRLKDSGEAVAGDVLIGMSGFAPSLLLALGSRVAARVPQRGVNTVTTNVPGPQRPLYAVGRRLLEAFPFVPIATQMRTGVAIFSYDGQLNVAMTADWDSVADVSPFTRGVEEGMAELLKAAEAASGEDG